MQCLTYTFQIQSIHYEAHTVKNSLFISPLCLHSMDHGNHDHFNIVIQINIQETCFSVSVSSFVIAILYNGEINPNTNDSL